MARTAGGRAKSGAAAAALLAVALLPSSAAASLTRAEAAADEDLAASADPAPLELSPDPRVRAAAAAFHALSGERDQAAAILATLSTLGDDCAFRARRAEAAGGPGCGELPRGEPMSPAGLPAVAARILEPRAGESGRELLTRVVGAALGGRLDVRPDRFSSSTDDVALEGLLYLDDRVLLVARSFQARLATDALASVVARLGPALEAAPASPVERGLLVPPGWATSRVPGGWSHAPEGPPDACHSAIVILEERGRGGNVTARRRPAQLGGTRERVTLSGLAATRSTWAVETGTCVSYEMADAESGRSAVVRMNEGDGAGQVARAVAESLQRRGEE